MSERFKGLTKLPKEPVAKLLSAANIKLKTELDAPANAQADVVLAELEAKEAWADVLMVFSALLPGRERVWWSCLAARDIVGPASDSDPMPLKAAEAWVRKPDDENWERVSTALTHAAVMDDTKNCATSALYADGYLGPGDLKQHAAPPGASEVSALAMNIVALSARSDTFHQHMQLLIDRAVDIARGGNGRVQPNS